MAQETRKHPRGGSPPTSLGHEEHLRAQPVEMSGKPTAQARCSPSGTERTLRRSLLPDPRGGLRLLARSPALDSTGSPRLRALAIMDGKGRRGETRDFPDRNRCLHRSRDGVGVEPTRPLLLSPIASA